MLLTHDEIVALGYAPEIYQRLGVDPETRRSLVVDGDVGPKTRAAIYLDPRVVVTPIALAALGELLAGAQEKSGNNTGPCVTNTPEATA